MASKGENRIGRYIHEVLGIEVKAELWPEANRLPFALRDAYDISRIRILGAEFLLLHAPGGDDLTPATIGKHMKWLEQEGHPQGIFATHVMPSYNRKRLIEQKVPFVVPGNQLYLPDLGIDLREHLRRERSRKRRLGPAAQVLILAHLLKRHDLSGATATGLAEPLGYSKMTMGRAIDELEGAGLVDAVTEGRERRVRMTCEGRELWKRALPLLRSPVARRVYLEQLPWPVGSVAGLPALASLTMLAPSQRETRAVGPEEWKALQADANLRIIPERSRELARVELELWRYDPEKISRSGQVDPLSLYLSLHRSDDERVEGALRQLLEEHVW